MRRSRFLFGFALLVVCLTAQLRAATITVCASGCDHTSVDAAVDAAAAGDTIVLTSGETFTGQITLPTTQHATKVTIKSSTACPNRRVTAADASIMATITMSSAGQAVIGEGVKNWEFECVRFSYDVDYPTHAGIELTNANLGGGNFRNTDQIVFDRIIVTGGSSGSWRHAIIAHGSNITLDRSHIENIRSPGAESKGFLMIDGPGPVTITDNFIEAASINILFGGGNQSSSAHIPDNITVDGNHLFKRMSWQGQGFNVKNLFELKCATDVVVTDNLMENSFTDGQAGYGVVLTSRNDEGGSPYATVQRVEFKRNIVRGVERGIQFLGLNDGSETVQATDITISENLWIVQNNWGLAGGEVGTLIVEHNTIVNSGSAFWLMTPPGEGLVWDSGGQRSSQYAVNVLTFRNNLLYHRDYGLICDAQGTAALDLCVETSYTWTHNILAGGSGTYPNSTPTSTWFPSVAQHETNFNPDHTLTAASSYNNAGSDSLDLGWFGGNTPPGGGDPPPDDPPPNPPPSGNATVQHVETSGPAQDLSCTACQWTFTVSTASNRILLVRYPYFGASELVTSVTTNPNGTGAIGLTKLTDCAGANSRRVAFWYLVAPATGSHVVTVNQSQATSGSFGVSEYSDVHQSSPFGTSSCAGGTGTSATTNVTATSTRALVVDGIRWGFSETRTAVPAQGQGQRFYDVASAASDRLATVSTTTMTWTLNDGGADWALLAVPLMPVEVPSMPRFRIRIR